MISSQKLYQESKEIFRISENIREILNKQEDIPEKVWEAFANLQDTIINNSRKFRKMAKENK